MELNLTTISRASSTVRPAASLQRKMFLAKGKWRPRGDKAGDVG